MDQSESEQVKARWAQLIESISGMFQICDQSLGRDPMRMRSLEIFAEKFVHKMRS